MLTILLVGGVLWFVIVRETKDASPIAQDTPSSKVVPTDDRQNIFEKYPQHVEVIPGTDEAWYNIPELGIRMKLNKEFAEGLIYQYIHVVTNDLQEEWDATHFSTKSLTAIDKGCSPEEGRPLGTITKTKGDVKELAKTDVFYSSRLDDIIQIGEYYFMWTGPQATCWDPKNDEAVQKVRGPEIYKAIQDGVKTIQLIPSK